jgi:hypothetical protein
MKTYTLLLLEQGKPPETILEAEKDLHQVRRVASSRRMTRRLRKGLGRRLEIQRDGKIMRGGRFALDEAIYQLWLEANQPEEGK